MKTYFIRHTVYSKTFEQNSRLFSSMPQKINVNVKIEDITSLRVYLIKYRNREELVTVGSFG